MRLHYYSHQGAEHILGSTGLLLELDTLLRALPLPVWRNKSACNKRLDVVQQMLNSLIEDQMVRRGWLSQAQVIASAHEFYADFYRLAPRPWSLPGLPDAAVRALCEVQFGNVARLGLDNEKFRIGRAEGRCDVGVEIVPLRSLAQRIDTSVATFEKCRQLLERLGCNGLPTPVLVIGLDVDEETEVWDLRAEPFPLIAVKQSAQCRQRMVQSRRVGAS